MEFVFVLFCFIIFRHILLYVGRSTPAVLPEQFHFDLLPLFCTLLDLAVQRATCASFFSAFPWVPFLYVPFAAHFSVAIFCQFFKYPTIATISLQMLLT
jgi:hypothetical protein